MMSRRWVLAIAAAAVSVCGAGPAAAVAGAVQVNGPWGKAIEVPGLGALSNGQAAQVFSASCPSPGNCAAGGDYRNHGRRQGFVVSQKNARWGTAIEVPGLGGLNKGGLAEVNEVSCASAGNCAAGGDYLSDGRHHAFVASERNGAWGTATEVAGLGRHGAEILTVSCASAGNCAAGGDYTNTFGQQGFVVSEKDGHWGAAIKLPGLGVLNTGGAAYVLSVSCASAASCTAGGTYSYNEGSGASLGFVVSERNGRWGHVTKVPGLAALNRGGDADVESVSCVSAGNCGADGNYVAGHDREQGFVVSEKNGHWGQAIEMPGLGALNSGGLAVVLSVSCGSAGDCAAGGWYSTPLTEEGFVVTEKNGHWGTAIEVPGLAALTKGGFDSQVNSVSCGSAGSCAAGGDYSDRRQGQEGFVAVERNGRWGTAAEVPGLAALNKGGTSGVNVVSCASAGTCVAGGSYGDPHGPNGFASG